MKFHERHIECEKPDTEAKYDSFYRKLKQRQNKSVVMEIRIVIYFPPGEGSVGK